MIYLCAIKTEQDDLKLAFHHHHIKLNGDIYFCDYHMSSPQFMMHHHSGLEKAIMTLKAFENMTLKDMKIIFYIYRQDQAYPFLTMYIHKVIQEKQLIKLICLSSKKFLKRRIGRIYSDIL